MGMINPDGDTIPGVSPNEWSTWTALILCTNDQDTEKRINERWMDTVPILVWELYPKVHPKLHPFNVKRVLGMVTAFLFIQTKPVNEMNERNINSWAHKLGSWKNKKSHLISSYIKPKKSCIVLAKGSHSSSKCKKEFVIQNHFYRHCLKYLFSV
jgi:hypothetical protein